MGRLIDADELWFAVMKRASIDSQPRAVKRIAKMVDNAPTVEPKTGHWVKNDEGDYHCSLCNAIVESDERCRHYWAYCYHCGANMEEEYEAD